MHPLEHGRREVSRDLLYIESAESAEAIETFWKPGRLVSEKDKADTQGPPQQRDEKREERRGQGRLLISIDVLEVLQRTLGARKNTS
jgi:hypothetical protein